MLCKHIHMATNLALDDRLIEEARQVGRHKTKREAVSAAPAEYGNGASNFVFWRFSASWISIRNTTTKPNAAGNTHDGPGGHFRLVAGPATKTGGSEPWRTGSKNRVARVSAGRSCANCRPSPPGIAFGNTGGGNLSQGAGRFAGLRRNLNSGSRTMKKRRA